MAAIQPLGKPQERGERPHGPPRRPTEHSVLLVGFLRLGLPVIARGKADDLDLLRLETAQAAIADQVLRMTMVTFVADVHADVVEQRRILEPLAFRVPQPVHAACLIEHRQAQLRDVARVIRRVAAAFTELDDASAANVGITIHLSDVPAVALNVVEHQPFTQREIAECQFVRTKTAQYRVQKNGSRDDDVGPTRIETCDVQPGLEIQFGQAAADRKSVV